MNSFIVSSFLAVVAGFIGLTYNEVAIKYGWPIGKLFFDHKGWVVTISWMCVIPGGFELIHQMSWILGAISVVLAFVSAVIITYILKERIQWIAILMVIASILTWTIGGAEIITVK